MNIKNILMNFDDINKRERSAEFSVNGKKIMVCLGVNPWTGGVLASVYLDREIVVENVVCVSGEAINNGYCDIDIGGYLYLLSSSEHIVSGNRIHYSDLGSIFNLYFISFELEV